MDPGPQQDPHAPGTVPLKIDASGSGGVRFSDDYSYTAHFDGKPYDLQNSPQRYRELISGRSAHSGRDLPPRRAGHAEGPLGGFRRMGSR